MPPGTLSLILFILEFIMLIIIVIKNRDHQYFWIIFWLMLLLQVYQLSEFLICIGIDSNIIGRVAFVSITFLPPMGHYLTTKVVNWKHKEYLIWFALGTFFALFFIFAADPVCLIDCNPLYAVYEYELSFYYAFFYFGGILNSIFLIIIHMVKNKGEQPRNRRVLPIIGYMLFLVPMGSMVFVNVEVGTAIPSIMCKWAGFLAIFLFVYSFNDKIKKESNSIEIKDIQNK